MKNLDNFTIFQKKVLFRADLNVPLVNGKITDKSRILAIKSSIKKLINQQNIIFIISHFGRPQGKIQSKYSLSFICSVLEKELQIEKLHFLNKLDQKSISDKIKNMNFGDICLVENIRFYPEEENINLDFAKKITSFFDVYVNDSFSASHRNHTSITGFSKYLPAVAGDELLKEINNINLFLKNKRRPNIAIIGGSKISTKIGLLNNIINLFSTVVIGGAMANTFLLSNNYLIGKSLVEKDFIETARNIQVKAKELNCEIILPVDVVCSKKITDKKSITHSNIDNILEDQIILDIGNKTIKKICDEIKRSKMLLWNGPMGVFEHKPFDQSTIEIANTIGKYAKKLNIDTLAGGGDTISAINQTNTKEGFTYISNAGGAFLEWLEGKESPGVLALKKNII